MVHAFINSFETYLSPYKMVCMYVYICVSLYRVGSYYVNQLRNAVLYMPHPLFAVGNSQFS